MEQAEIQIGAAGADVSSHLFGALVEHFGTGLYGGIWDAARDVPRADVAAAIRGLGVTMLRYPGGCFSDWYHWRDGVGPRAARPTYDATYWTDFRFDVELPDPDAFGRAMGPVETNAFGTDEFLRYCVDVDAEPMLAANFGSGDAKEAAEWVAHTNHGNAPRPVRWWCIGNETYGPWEIGHCAPDVYGRGFAEFALAMRAVDRNVWLVAVGSAGSTGPYTGKWNSSVLAEAGDEIDALSVHSYFPGPWLGRALRDDEADYRQIAAGADRLGALLDDVIAEVDAAVGPDRQLPLALDEWNLWVELEDLLRTNRRLCDAVFFAGCYNRLLERAGRVRFAMISHLVNCMAPIQTRGDRHFVTSAYLVGLLYRHCARRYAAPVDVACGTFDVAPFADTAPLPVTLTDFEAPGARSSPSVDAAATVDSTGATVFVTNRLLDRAVEVTVIGLPGNGDARLRTIMGPGPFSSNDVDRPATLGFQDATVVVGDGRCRLELAPHTVGALTMAAGGPLEGSCSRRSRH